MSVTVSTQLLDVRLRSGELLQIPYWRVETGKPGPCLLLVAAQHGNEVQGSEVIRRFVEASCRDLQCGSVIAVPFANLPAIRDRRPHVRMKAEQPYSAPASKKVNMNLRWPGNPRGSLPSRLVAAIHRELFDEVTHVADLHCWTRCWAPTVLIRDGAGLRELALALGQRFVDIRPPTSVTLGGYACSTGRIGFSFEFSGQYVIDEKQVAIGLNLLGNMAKIIGIFDGDPEILNDPILVSDECEKLEVLAPCDGLFAANPGLNVCDPVEKGQVLGTVLDDRTLETHEICAPVSGYLRAFGAHRPDCDVAMPGMHPYVTAGEKLAIVQWKSECVSV